MNAMNLRKKGQLVATTMAKSLHLRYFNNLSYDAGLLLMKLPWQALLLMLMSAKS